MEMESYLKTYQKRVQSALMRLLPSPRKTPISLHKAMRYSALNGGKRLRAALVYATGEALKADLTTLDPIAASIEMIHAFSLIHDDLPAIDNDDLRRGKPSCHKAFSEGIALLAGDALHTLTFDVLANLDEQKIPPKMKIEMIRLLTKAVGSEGIIGGEVLDIEMENKEVSLKELGYTYKLKTGELLTASILLGAHAAACHDESILGHLKTFGDCLGLAFQIHDDIIGIQSDTKTLGKPQGSDIGRNKPTYPSKLGIEKSIKLKDKLYNQAITALNTTKLDVKKLKEIAAYIVQRNY